MEQQWLLILPCKRCTFNEDGHSENDIPIENPERLGLMKFSKIVLGFPSSTLMSIW